MHCYLILGDGNFSFSLVLARRCLRTNDESKIVATSLESLAAVLTRTHAEENLRRLNTCENVQVLHEIDGTRLGTHQGLNEISMLYDTIIFNFPHIGGKNKIRSNQTLLKDFFVSVASSGLLADGGEVQVMLCRGQGGTPVDSDSRGYKNSWKVIEMAAAGGLVLDRVESFMISDVPGYTPTGYRGHSDKGFNLEGALRHVFRFPAPSRPSLYPPCYLHDVSFWCTGGEFDLKMLRDVVEEVTSGGGCVQSVELLEVYKPLVNVVVSFDTLRNAGEEMMCGGDAEALRIAYCYRVSYQSRWEAVSRSKAAQLQQLLRYALHSKAGLELR